MPTTRRALFAGLAALPLTQLLPTPTPPPDAPMYWASIRHGIAQHTLVHPGPADPDECWFDLYYAHVVDPV